MLYKEHERWIEYSLADWMNYHRKKIGMTQKELADIVSCSAVSIRGYENGLYSPTLTRRRNIVTAMRCRLEIVIVTPNGDRIYF